MIFKSNLKERIKKPNCSLKEISENGIRANWNSIMTRASVKIASMKSIPVKMILKASFKFSLLLFVIGQNSIILHSCTKNKLRKILYEIKSRGIILKASDSSLNMINITIFLKTKHTKIFYKFHTKSHLRSPLLHRIIFTVCKEWALFKYLNTLYKVSHCRNIELNNIH